MVNVSTMSNYEFRMGTGFSRFSNVVSATVKSDPHIGLEAVALAAPLSTFFVIRASLHGSSIQKIT